MKANTIFNTDCRDGLKLLPDNSVNCCVTSPPYYGLRRYYKGVRLKDDAPDWVVEELEKLNIKPINHER
jgi:DNA modification methylase